MKTSNICMRAAAIAGPLSVVMEESDPRSVNNQWREEQEVHVFIWNVDSLLQLECVCPDSRSSLEVR